jgi:hypothetical protein
MIINITQTKPGTELEKELSILTRDTHSPSGLLIHEAINLSCSTSVGFGEVYRVKPKRCPVDFATAAYKELANRSPALLDALLLTAGKQSPFLEVNIQTNSNEEPESLAAYAKLARIPLLLAWMAGGAT